jgi:hypothetical protein
MIRETRDGAIYDGHHGVRAAADDGMAVEVLVIDEQVPPSARSTFEPPWRRLGSDSLNVAGQAAAR